MRSHLDRPHQPSPFLPTLLMALAVFPTLPVVVLGSQPATVSPGAVERIERIAGRCPTFSWNPDLKAAAHEIVVYRVGLDGSETTSYLRRTIPGSAGSWTPALSECLRPGERYAWSVRALLGTEAGPWSPPSMLEVAAGPSQDELEQALAVVRRHLEVGDGTDGTAGVESGATNAVAARSAGSAPPPNALSPPATTQLSVDGNIDATSFTGDGENLANVASDAELASHAATASAHHPPTVDTTCDGQACDGTSFSNVTAVAGDSATDFFSSGAVEEARIDTAIQRRVMGTCPAGESIQTIAADGTVTCEADDVGTGDITGVTATTGLTGGGDTGTVSLSADTTYLQRRVSGTCPTGESIQTIAADGTVTCEADDVGTGDITGVTTSAPSGLDGGCLAGDCDLSVDPTDFMEPVQLKSGIGPVVVDTNTSTYETIDSLLIAAPVAGTVLAIASASLECTSCNPFDGLAELRTGLTTDAAGTPSGSVSVFEIGGAERFPATVIAQEKLSVSAGMTTVYWRGAVTDAVSDTIEVSDWRISLMFFPD